MGAITFYLGTHMPNWLGLTDIPLFLSDVTMRKRKNLQPSKGIWALDSGGFSELSKHGAWTVRPEDYARRVQRYMAEVGNLQWAAIQDWMCEPVILAKTGLTVREHQERTVRNYFELQELAPEVPWVPVIQGWHLPDYFAHVDMYNKAGVNVKGRVFGVGSICRRQHSKDAARIITMLATSGIRLHGFGLKMQGLKKVAVHLESADSLAWSYDARRGTPLPGHDKPGVVSKTGHMKCSSCLPYAMKWRDRLLGMFPKQGLGPLFDGLD